MRSRYRHPRSRPLSPTRSSSRQHCYQRDRRSTHHLGLKTKDPDRRPIRSDFRLAKAAKQALCRWARESIRKRLLPRMRDLGVGRRTSTAPCMPGPRQLQRTQNESIRKAQVTASKNSSTNRLTHRRSAPLTFGSRPCPRRTRSQISHCTAGNWTCPGRWLQ